MVMFQAVTSRHTGVVEHRSSAVPPFPEPYSHTTSAQTTTAAAAGTAHTPNARCHDPPNHCCNGTVADAKPDYEFIESENKAKAVLQAFEVAAEQPEWP